MPICKPTQRESHDRSRGRLTATPPRVSALLFGICLLAGCLVAACTGSLPHGPAPGELAGGCTTDGDCKSGVCLTEESYAEMPGGYCTSDCSATSCPEGAECKTLGERQVCLLTCSAQDGCRDGYACRQGVCQSRCQADSDCDPGTRCSDGVCVARAAGELGAACQAESECQSGVCLSPEGVCSQACSRPGDCPSGFSCVLRSRDSNGDGKLDAIDSYCLSDAPSGAGLGSRCSDDSGCLGLTCQFGVCVAPCTADADCPAEMTCADTHRHLPASPLPLAVGARLCLPRQGIVELATGEVENGQYLDIPVPSNASSFSLITRVGDTTVFAGPGHLDDPRGKALYTGFYDDLYKQILRFYPAEEISAMLMPNTPALALEAGIYQTQLIAFGLDSQGREVARPDVKPQARVLFRLGQPAGGALNINFHFLNLSGHECVTLDAAAAQSSRSFQSIVSGIGRIYGQAGISVGRVGYYDIRNRSDLNNLTLGNGYTQPQLGKLLSLSANAPADAVNFFIVRNIRPTGVLGISGGVPGPPGVAGTVHSGIAISGEGFCYPDELDMETIFAHECGHYLGLFHTVEQDGHTDPIPDTPTSVSNLMYWEAANGTSLTPGQTFVMVRNPLIQ